MSLELEGKLHQIGAEQVVGSAGTFKKRTIVIATNEQYVQHIPIDFVQDKCSILDKYTIGEEVKISVNVRGNEYQGKFYVSLNGWKIEKLDTSKQSPEPVEKTAEFAPAPSPMSSNQEEPDDLPF
jgi:hypothetical protein